MKNRKVVLYIAMSMDGFIAKENDDINFLSVVESPGEDYGYEDFIKTVDTVIMGRRTYDKVLGFGIDFPHKERKCYVISASRKGRDENVEYYSGDLAEQIRKIRETDGKDIFIDGGAEVVNELLQQNLIDNFIISIIPYFTGGGVALFKNGRPEHKLKFLRSVTFPTGLVQLWYARE